MDLVWSIKPSLLVVFGNVNIGDCPFLAELVSELGNSDALTFTILTVEDLDDSVVFDILQVVLGVFELLEPLSIGGPELQVVGSSTGLNVERLVFEHLISDGL